MNAASTSEIRGTADSSPLWRLGFGASLATAMGAAPFIVAAIAVLAPFIIADIGLSRLQVGSLTSTIYVVAALAAPRLGRTVDSVGGRTMVALLFTVSGFVLVGVALAPSYLWLAVTVALTGLPMGLANPVTNQLVQSRIAPGNRGLLMGVKQSGVKMGQLAASAALPTVALALGWRMTLVAALPLMLCGLLLSLLVLHDGGAGPRRIPHQAGSASGALDPLVRRLTIFGFLMGTGQSVVGAYLTLFAFEELAFSVTAAGAVTALVGLVAVVARVFWGRAAERLTTLALPLFLVAVGSALSVVLIVMAAFVDGSLIWMGAVLFGSTASVWMVIGMLALLRTVAPATTGRSTGMVFRGFSAGFILGPLGFGYAADGWGSYTPGWLGIAVVFLAASWVTRSFRGQPVGADSSRG